MFSKLVFVYVFLSVAVELHFLRVSATDSTGSADATIQSLEALVQKQSSTLQVLQTRQYLMEQMLQQQETTIHDLQATRDAQANTLKDLEDKLDREVAELQAGRDSQANVLQSVQAEQLAQTTVIQGLQTAVDEQNSTLQQHASTLQTQQTLHLMNEAKQSQQDVSIQAVQASCDVQVSAIDKLHGQVNGQGILMLDLRNNQSIIQEQLDHVATWMKKQAAFFVDLKSPFSAADVDVGHRTPIKFNHVLLNIGDNYNSSTGVFTAPFDGVYLFTLHIYAMSGGDRTEVGIFVADSLKATAVSEGSSDPFDHDTCSTVLHLKHGDHVTAQQTAHDTTLWGSSGLTSFMGVLLHADSG